MKIQNKLLIIATTLFLAACGQIGDGSIGTISDFFPFGENTTLVMENEQEPLANHEIFTTHISGNRVQQHISGLNIAHALVLELDDGTLRQVFSFIDHPVFEDITDIQPNINWVILQEPLVLGNYWSTGDGDAISTITGIGAQVVTPAGTFSETIQVTTQFPNGDHVVTYFAVGHGIVYDSWNTTFGETVSSATSELVQVREGGMEIEIPVFFPAAGLETIEVEMMDITIYTNQDFPSLFTEVLQETVAELENVTVNNITVNRMEGFVSVDFSRNFLDINMGSALEGMLLHSLASTFGMFYRVENFHITLEGENYNSGHFYFGESDFIDVGSF
ncbi:MAG: hypothetical protein FWG63_04280 [Defluviitaleaceae bacterium]|nr:hypothetical protein [Defluviitaleaceae bacterium]